MKKFTVRVLDSKKRKISYCTADLRLAIKIVSSRKNCELVGPRGQVILKKGKI